MSVRCMWKGCLRVAKLTLGVKLFSAVSEDKPQSLNQLHGECGSRITQKKTCPIHGDVEAADLMHGYEVEPGKYVVLSAEELQALVPDTKAIEVGSLFPAGSLDRVRLSGKHYYVVPDAPLSAKGFQLLCDAMEWGALEGLAQVVLYGKRRLMTLRAVAPAKYPMLLMSALHLDAQITGPDAFAGELAPMESDEGQLKQMSTILKSMARYIDFSAYQDDYAARLLELVEAKVAGREVVTAPQIEEPGCLSLADALEQSVAELAPVKKRKRKAA